MVKLCPTCGIEKSVEEFGKNRSKKDGLSTQCSSCKNQSQSKWYQNNRSRHIEKVRERNKQVIKENYARILVYLDTHPCTDCGETDPIVLQFDHINPNEKSYDIPYLVGAGFSWNKIMSEIEKCQVRCVNCHTRRTYHQQGWSRKISG